MARKKVNINTKKTEINIDTSVVEIMIGNGFKEYEVATFYGLSPEAFSRLKTPEINQAIRQGKIKARKDLVESMAKLAKNSVEDRVKFSAIKYLLSVIHHLTEGKDAQSDESAKVTIIEETE